jgi:A/G-specific adenine glycosylase
MEIFEILERWYNAHKRDLPWRRTDSPYLIWLSEIILQQTRVSQGLAYYLRFAGKYPTVFDLAKAPVDEVLKLWQGLGYYTRARNLHSTARKIVTDFHGRFPEEYEELIKLKGIGPYSAAAIASIAFKKPVAVVDGNVLRVMARLFGLDTPVDTPEGNQVIGQKALEILNPSRPGTHNQAMMELGALICLPRNPACSACPLSIQCRAFHEGKTGLFPVKVGKTRVNERFFDYLFIQYNGYTYLNKRKSKDIWNSLYEFPLMESPAEPDSQMLTSSPEWKNIFEETPVKPDPHPRAYKHRLTHQLLHCRFHRIEINHKLNAPGLGFIEVALNDLDKYAVPRIIDRYLTDLGQEQLP